GGALHPRKNTCSASTAADSTACHTSGRNERSCFFSFRGRRNRNCRASSPVRWCSSLWCVSRPVGQFPGRARNTPSHGPYSHLSEISRQAGLRQTNQLKDPWGLRSVSFARPFGLCRSHCALTSRTRLGSR